MRVAETHFLERLADASCDIPDGHFSRLRRASTARHFVDLEGRFRTKFASFIPEFEVDETGARRSVDDDKALKNIDRVFDVIAPRMFLIGRIECGWARGFEHPDSVVRSRHDNLADLELDESAVFDDSRRPRIVPDGLLIGSRSLGEGRAHRACIGPSGPPSLGPTRHTHDLSLSNDQTTE
jgi:hypothetical protein